MTDAFDSDQQTLLNSIKHNFLFNSIHRSFI